MVLEFGLLKSIFKASPDDDEFLHFEGQKEVAGKVSPNFQLENIPPTANIAAAAMQSLKSITFNNLKSTQKVLLMFSIMANSDTDGTGLQFRIEKDGNLLGLMPTFEADDNYSSMVSHIEVDTPTAATHTYELFARGSGADNNDINLGRFVAIVFNSSIT